MDAAEWNSVVTANHASFLQSWEWGTFQKEVGNRIRRIRLDVEGDVKVQTNAILLGLPFGQKVLSAPFPFFNTPVTAEMIAALMHVVQQFAAQEKVCAVRIDAQTQELADMLKNTGFTRRRSTQPENTLIVDLTKSEEDLLSEMHSKTRYNIRLAEKHGVTVRRCDKKNTEQFAKDIEQFLKLLAQTTERDAFAGHDAQYYRTMLTVLSGGTANAELYLAVHEGETLAGAIIMHHNAHVTYLHGASSNTNRQYMAPFALHWSAMRDAKKLGAVTYDFWGIAPDDNPSHPWAGITRFKKGFGGKIVNYAGGWELPMPGFWGTVYRLTNKLRKGR